MERMNNSWIPAILALFALCAGTALAQAAPGEQFVVIFRQPQPLTEADRQRVSEETRAWAKQQNDKGHKLDPHILAPESHWIGPDVVDGPAPVTALLFFEARDFTQAVEVARTHPAVRYGVSVEVRPWAPPPAPRP